MKSRERILARLKENEPLTIEKPRSKFFPLTTYENKKDTFISMLTSIGGVGIKITKLQQINDFISLNLPNAKNIVSTISTISSTIFIPSTKPHALENVEIAILTGALGIAENGSVWLTEKTMLDRALPFICEHLFLVLKENQIVHHMEEAYALIASTDYQFATFIAGPSKTADIEQSLVLGAQGAKTTSVFILKA